ncbi:MAG: glycosyltransferase family 9 protein [Magnetococcales bacterium]|nr:glycosyltransferase family 9 protein [Magnetococcales bacterium]
MTSPSFLFIHVTRIGDSLFATPAMRAIAETYPGARIDVLGHPKRAEVFENIPFIQNIGQVTPKTAWMRGRLRSHTYDWAFVYGFDEPLVSLGLRLATQTVAFRQRNEKLNQQLTHLVEPPPFQSEHAIKQLLRLPASMGATTENLRIAYATTPQEQKNAQRVLGDFAHGTGPLIGMQPCSFPTKSYRDWPISHFQELCLKIAQHWPTARFVIFGGPDDRPKTQPLADSLQNKALHLTGKLSLRQTGAVMPFLQLYLGVDTGLTHMMRALDTPMVLLYHCLSLPDQTGPLQHPHCQFLTLSPGNRPCNQTLSLGEITVETAFAAVKGML